MAYESRTRCRTASSPVPVVLLSPPPHPRDGLRLLVGEHMLGLHFGKAREKAAVDNEKRPIKMIEVSPGIYHIVYAD